MDLTVEAEDDRRMGSCIIIPATEPIHTCLALLPKVLSLFSAFSMLLLVKDPRFMCRFAGLPSPKAFFPYANHHRCSLAHSQTCWSSWVGLLPCRYFSSILTENPSAGVLMLASEPKDCPLRSKGKQKSVIQDTRIAHVLGERAITELDDESPSSA